MRYACVFLCIINSAVANAQEIPPGVKFIATGELWPADALKAIRDAKRELDKARETLARLNYLTKNWGVVVGSIGEKISELEKKLEAASGARRMGDDLLLGMVGELTGAISALREDINDINGELKNLKNIPDKVTAIEGRLSKLEDISWSLGMFLSGTFDYSTEFDDKAVTNVAGVLVKLAKGKNLVTLSIGAGLNDMSRNFLWSAMGTAERMLGYGLSLGGAIMGSWDVGKWEGTSKQYYSAGPVLRWTFADIWSVYGSVNFGVGGKKESVPVMNAETTNPEFSPKVGVQLGLNVEIF